MVQDHPLKTYRKTQSPPLSQEQLAGLLDVERPTLARWETGKQKIGPKSLVKIAQVTGIRAAELRPEFAELIEGSA